MQKLNPDELRQFLERSGTSEPPENYLQPDAFAKVLNGSPMANNLACSMMRLIFTMGPVGAAQSIWATGFQMGRAFECDRREVAELNRLIGPITPPQSPKRRIRRKAGA